MIDLNFIQLKIFEWASKNFANPSIENTSPELLNERIPDRIQQLMGIAEETGELFHTDLKEYQKIRGYDNKKFANDEREDAVGDIVIYLLNYCSYNNIKLEEVILNISSKVLKRDWIKCKLSGGENPSNNTEV